MKVKFDDLDKKMRLYETAHDFCVLPETYIVARLDGRGFTTLTKKTVPFKAPFDEKFRDLMIETTKHLMKCGFNIVYGYTESDEISLLFNRSENTFGRKLRKINSVLAGEASAKFSTLLGKAACFDCRVSQLPNAPLVVDYFRWRNEDAHRNALNAHCYWLQRSLGSNAKQATTNLIGKSVAEKNEVLFQNGIQFNKLPLWQRRGIGVIWSEYQLESINQATNRPVKSTRRKLQTIWDLPMREQYSRMVSELVLNDL